MDLKDNKAFLAFRSGFIRSHAITSPLFGIYLIYMDCPFFACAMLLIGIVAATMMRMDKTL